MGDIEDINLKTIYGDTHLYLNDYYKDLDVQYPTINSFMMEILEFSDNNSLDKATLFNNLKKTKLKYNINPKHSILIYMLKKYVSINLITPQKYNSIVSILKTKTCRSTSGILEVAVMTSPGKFSCAENCYYCPDQKDMPRSYIKEEPAVRRAAQHNFDTVKQVYNRLSAYSCNGHEIDKLEVIVLGGTWSNYDDDYQREFMRNLYYAANTWFNRREERFSLQREKTLNENALVKIVGLTIETRPDYITPNEITKFIEYGVTRVQLGIQTIDDKLLKKINRGCYTKDTINALEMLMNYGFKILIHIMPNLPGSNPIIDKHTFSELVSNPDLQADEWKIYPTSVTTTSDKDTLEVYSVIEKWFNDGKYIPYSNDELMEVLIHAKSIIPKYIRISRIFRDIPIDNIIGGANVPHMRQVVQKLMANNNLYCKCIKCREIKGGTVEHNTIYYECDRYESKNAIHYFISANIPSNSKNGNHSFNGTLIGFIRLCIKKTEVLTLPVLHNASIVRELHVYGQMNPTYIKQSSNTQHKGIGTQLLKLAENKTREHNLEKIAIISGVGVRNFYRKNGYTLQDNYMVKSLSYNNSKLIIAYVLIPIIVGAAILYLSLKLLINNIIPTYLDWDE